MGYYEVIKEMREKVETILQKIEVGVEERELTYQILHQFAVSEKSLKVWLAQLKQTGRIKYEGDIIIWKKRPKSSKKKR